MKIIPKYSNGGSNSLFTIYNPVRVRVPSVSDYQRSSNINSESTTIKSSDKSEKSDETKGKLAEKDLFDMIKDINGLPNEMKSIIINLQRIFETQNLIGADPSNLASTYLDNLYKLKLANQNKIKFDDAVKTAKDNGTLGEAAITLNGGLIVQDDKGKLQQISLDEYQNNKETYHILSNSNLAWLRKYSPNMAFTQNDDVFDIINNGMSYEVFQDLLDKSKSALGSYKYEETGILGKEALSGLRVLQRMSKEDQEKYINNALDGIYKYTQSTDSNEQQIASLIDYLTVTLPNRAKVWASLKTKIQDPNQATQALVKQYLLGNLKNDSKFTIDYEGTKDSLKSKGSSSGNSGDVKEGFWRQLQSGKAGTTNTSITLIGKSKLSVEGKYYGTTPGLDENKSLNKYIGDSKVGYLIKNNRSITFGDQSLSPESFNDVMVNSGAGAQVVTLPITQDGKVNFEILSTYSKVENKLRQLGIKPSDQDYEQKKSILLNKVGLGYLVDAQNGRIDPRFFGQFLILEGVTSNKAYGINGKNEKQALKASDYVDDVSNNDDLYKTVEQALSDKEHGEYTLDHNWISFNNDELYKGNIYIPLNENALNAMNADDNEVKQGSAKDMEAGYQRMQKDIQKYGTFNSGKTDDL